MRWELGFFEMIVRLRRVEMWEEEESAEVVSFKRWTRREGMEKEGR